MGSAIGLVVVWLYGQSGVSILVFLEWVLQFLENGIFKDDDGVFQSLFSWSGFCNVLNSFKICLEYDVSILVFLEWVLQWPSLFRWYRTGWRFNPCFPGVGSAIKHELLVSSIGGGFNPCFPGVGSAICGE